MLGTDGVGALELFAFGFVDVFGFGGTVKLFVFGERRIRFRSGGEASFFGGSYTKIRKDVYLEYIRSKHTSSPGDTLFRFVVRFLDPC